MNSFLTGVHHLYRGFGLISTPGLRRYVIVPLLLNILVFIAFFLVLASGVARFDSWIATLMPAWLHWLGDFLWVLFFISYFLVFIYTFITIANLVCSPFNSVLSEKIALYLEERDSQSHVTPPVKHTLVSLLSRQLAILAYYVPRAIFMLILFFIPVIQVIAPLCWFLFNAWYVLLIYLDYPMDNCGASFREMRKFVTLYRSEALGLGISMLLASMIPIVNFFTIPASVAAATVFWLSHKKRD